MTVFPWIKLRANWIFDPAIRQVSNAAQLAFIRSICVSKLTDGGGLVHASNMAEVRRDIRRFSDVVDALTAVSLWEHVPRSDDVRVARFDKYQSPPRIDDHVKTQVDKGRRANSSTTAPTTEAAFLARAKRVSKKEEPFRSPSGPDRNGSARAEPRDAGGAARPAPAGGDQGGPSGTVAGLGQLQGAELVKANIRKTRSTGKPTPLRQPEWQQRRNEPSPFEKAMDELNSRLPQSGAE